MNGQPGPEHGCRSLTDAVLVQTRMLSAQVHYRFSYTQTQPQKAYFIIFTLLAHRDWSPGVSKAEVLRAIEAESQHWGENRGWGEFYRHMFQMDAGLLGVQRLGLHQGLSCTLGMGRGGRCPRRGMGGTSVSLQVTRVGEGLRGAKGQALPSPGTLPGGTEETEIIRVFSWKSAFIRNQRPRILHHLNGLRSEN